MVRSAHFAVEEARLAPLLGALSLATDLGAGNPPESALRTAVIAARLGERLGLVGDALRDVYYTALLRYLGCSGFAHEEAALAGGDDLAYLATFQSADPARAAEIIGLALRELARSEPLHVRAHAVVRFLSQPRGYAELARAHCDQATALAATLGVGPGVVSALGEMYERFDGRGAPRALAGREIALPARVLSLAQALEVHARTGGPAAALAVARERRGAQFDPELVDAFLAAARPVLDIVTAPSAWQPFLDAEPAPPLTLDEASLDDVALAFARYVDLKSPFTLAHSTGVARLAGEAATRAGLGDDDARLLRRAALLHDLGRVSVPNGVWDKTGPLDSGERERVRQHAYHGARVLVQAPGLEPLAALVASHHERLDGGGYHRGVGGAALAPAARLLAAADVYHALTEARAHRAALTPEAAARELGALATRGALDADAVNAVLAAAGHARVRKAHPAGLTDREVEILVLVVRGLSNKEVGRALHISPVTVKNHVAHIYEKTGVATRSAAALYAVTNGLVEP
ncbi:MAG TPA: HD domain-containing phosphohydrolase [Polyangia bacterium]|nr:HD domain-containing phosphohydrolase [Polyangia bacterium]